MNETEKVIKEQFDSLEPGLQRVIRATPWKGVVQEIGKDNLLDTEQIVALEQETLFILYTMEEPRNYISNIIKNVGLSEEKALDIAQAVIDKIFDPIFERWTTEEASETKTSIPEIAPEIHPVVEEGEEAHEVTPGETQNNESRITNNEKGKEVKEENQQSKPEEGPQKDKVGIPDYRYPGGQDPYREPIE